MRNWIAAALLASAAMAVPAFAQDHDDGHGQHGGHEGDHPAAAGDHHGGAPQGGQPQRAQPAPQHVQMAPQQARGGPDGAQQRAQFEQRGGPDGANQRQQFEQRGGGQPGGNPYAGAQGRPDMRGQPGGNAYHGDARQGDARRYSAQPDNGVNVWHGGGRAGGDPRSAGRGYGQDARGGYGGGGGAWNRGWRQDRRYDWQGWRAGHRDIYRAGRYQPPYGFGYGYRRFGLGYRLPPVFFAEQYWIDNPDYYRLPPAYGDYRWVRYYNDALLIDLDDGQIVDAIPNFFY